MLFKLQSHLNVYFLAKQRVLRKLHTPKCDAIIDLEPMASLLSKDIP